jgi:hypothetical protein
MEIQIGRSQLACDAQLIVRMPRVLHEVLRQASIGNLSISSYVRRAVLKQLHCDGLDVADLTVRGPGRPPTAAPEPREPEMG